MTEAEIEALLADAGLVPGAAPLTKQQLTDRIMAILDRDWPLAMREASPAEYATWRDAAEPARLRAVAANLFNIRLAAYRQAVARLALPSLVEGPVVDPVTGEQTGSGSAAVAEDEAARAAAQAVIAATPEAVLAFDAA